MILCKSIQNWRTTSQSGPGGGPSNQLFNNSRLEGASTDTAIPGPWLHSLDHSSLAAFVFGNLNKLISMLGKHKNCMRNFLFSHSQLFCFHTFSCWMLEILFISMIMQTGCTIFLHMFHWFMHWKWLHNILLVMCLNENEIYLVVDSFLWIDTNSGWSPNITQCAARVPRRGTQLHLLRSLILARENNGNSSRVM